jgi:hypothetical protein
MPCMFAQAAGLVTTAAACRLAATAAVSLTFHLNGELLLAAATAAVKAACFVGAAAAIGSGCC